MDLKARYIKNDGRIESLRVGAVIRDALLGIVAIVVLATCWPFYGVPTGYRGVVTQFGAIKTTEPEGLAILPPWQKITNFSIRAEEANIKDAQGATSDTQPVHVSMTVRYSISVDKVAEVFEKYTHTGDLSSYVQTATQEIFKAVTAKYTAVDLIGKRSMVSSDIYTALQAKLSKYGAAVINIDMTNFDFSKDYMAAINEKVTQEQKRMGAENKLHTVEAEQKQKVAVAEADARALKAKADGEAYATVTAATAEARSVELAGRAKATAMEVQANALARNPVLVELAKAEKWDGKLPVNIYAGAPVPFMRMDK
jgi:prohibitin 2